MTDIPKTMRAVVLKRHGGLDALSYEAAWPVPQPAPSQVLIKVLATGMNNTDVNTRAGWYSKSVTEATTGDAYDSLDGAADNTWGGAGIQFPRIQGADICGRVVAAGAEADQSLIGKRVIADNWLRDWDDPLNMHTAGYFGSEADGGYAEYTVIDHRNVAAVNSDLTDAELATFSCSYATAEGMLDKSGVGADDVVLVTGASGGVGGALIQLAKRRGARVVALASPAKHAEVAKCSPDAILPRAPQNLKQALQDAIGRDHVTVVADIVAGDYFATLIEALDRGGRYVTSGAIAGPIVSLDLRTLYLMDLTFFGSTVNPPQTFRNLVSYIEAGEVKPMLAATYSLEDFKEGQQAFIDKVHTGNIVVVP
ncbi:alcohol dehydrogenase family protein [Pseudooctadecabacter jejudonensis]|uniref:D-arabitol-phosphate dehydrogenase n=1 Tax=Pseudooctadecabacter jejudonensis TaxID=1391910 RepID=A0A1Y5SQT2_9RHOB|nr:alcohol dehydrogenase family protein [Pseudooctadecabacter jejudonensis]SLN44483.1 D-arabitol-phosphate dehydrogenase [Pseudooctadecabacter jejudonensis]